MCSPALQMRTSRPREVALRGHVTLVLEGELPSGSQCSPAQEWSVGTPRPGSWLAQSASH